MGNIVFGEAIRISPILGSNLVHSYIATQAAVPAHCYDNSIVANVRVFPGLSIITPNLYGFYPIDGTSDSRNGHGLFETNSNKIGKMIQYYNKVDYALNNWDYNNILKPDWDRAKYWYHENDGNIDTYFPSNGAGDYFYHNEIIGYRRLYFPEVGKGVDNRYEILARGVQSRTRALGTISQSDYPLNLQMFSIRRNLQDSLLGFNELHYSHSRQFRSNVVKEWKYWNNVLDDFEMNN